MKYIVTTENGKSTLVSSKRELNRVIENIEEGPGIICTAWSKDTPAGVMVSVAEHIIGKEESMLIGLRYLVDNSTPLHEMLWEEFEKALS